MGAGQGTEPAGAAGSCADSWLRIIISNPYAYDGCNRSVDRTALADGFCFSVYVSGELFDPGAGNHRETDLKTVALDSRPSVAERWKFKRVPTTGCV